MSEYRNADGFQKTYTTKDVVIASSGSLSTVVDIEQLNIAGFLIPSSWTTAKLTFQVSPDGVTYGDAQDSSGNELQVTVAAGKFIGVNLAELSGIRFLKIRSGTSGTPVNQAADRTITIVLTNNAEASAGATVADGANTVEGATTDAAVVSDANGTISAKLRGLVKMIADIWDSTNHFFKVSQATALSKTIDSVEARIEGGTPQTFTASGQVASSAGRLRGIFVVSASNTPTIKLWNNTAASGAVLVNTFPVVAGTPYDLFEARFTAGCYITIGGTVECVVVTT